MTNFNLFFNNSQKFKYQVNGGSVKLKANSFEFLITVTDSDGNTSSIDFTLNENNLQDYIS